MEKKKSNFSSLPDHLKLYIKNNIQNMDYKSAKTFVDVFLSGYTSGDPTTIKIVENFYKIDSIFKIKLEDDLKIRSSNFIDLNRLQNNKAFLIKNEIVGNKEIFAHELGHALLCIVDGIKIPEEFFDIIFEIQENWSREPQKLESFLKEARNYKEKIWEQSKKDLEKFMEYNKKDMKCFIEKNLQDPILLRQTLERYYEKSKVDDILSNSNATQIREFLITIFRNEWGMFHFESLCNTDETMKIYSVLCGIIDSIYNGHNPYYESIYDNNFLRTHHPDYFLGFPTHSFEEQFADYTSIQLCNIEVAKEIGKALFGEKWFIMMEMKFQTIAKQLEQETFCYDYDQASQAQNGIQDILNNMLR